MAAYISFQPRDHYKTHLYTGTGASLATTFPETTAMAPDFVWIKNIDAADSSILTTSVVGATKYLSSDAGTAMTTNAESLKSFDSDGFTVGTLANINTNTEQCESFNWKMGNTTGIDLDGADLTPIAYSFNQTTRQSIIQWLGVVSSAPNTIPHGLGVVPQVILVKNYSGADNWSMYTETTGNTMMLVLETNDGEQNNPGPGTQWNDTTPTATKFTTGSNGRTGGGSSEYLQAFCFASVRGYSQFGSYEGNGNADGPFTYTGFSPAFVMIKRTDTIGNWLMFNNKVLGYNPDNDETLANDPGVPGAGDNIDLLSNGFKLKVSTAESNYLGGEFVYWAFAEFPFVSSNSKPTTAR